MPNLESHFKLIFKRTGNQDKIRNYFDKRRCTRISHLVIFSIANYADFEEIRNLKKNLRVTVFIIEKKGLDLKFYTT